MPAIYIKRRQLRVRTNPDLKALGFLMPAYYAHYSSSPAHSKVNHMAKALVKMPSKKQVEKSAADKKDDKAMRAGKKPGKKMPC